MSFPSPKHLGFAQRRVLISNTLKSQAILGLYHKV